MMRSLFDFDDDDWDGWIGWFDGSALPNRGQVAIGVVLAAPDGRRWEIGRLDGWGTSNEAEYRALRTLLALAVEQGADRLTVYGDSLLVIQQMAGRWSVASPALRRLHADCQALADRLQACRYLWVERRLNQVADRLSRQALDSCRAPVPF